MKFFGILQLIIACAFSILCSPAMAAGSQVHWNYPIIYANLRPVGTETKQSAYERLTTSIEKHIEKLAKSLPENQELIIDFRTFKLAGNVEMTRGTNRVRVIKGNRYPARMSFSFNLQDAAGNSYIGGEDHLTSTTAIVRTATNEPYSIEKKMLSAWFKDNF